MSLQFTEANNEAMKLAIDEYSLTLQLDEHRDHLGASLIGQKCERKLWYSFRWVQLTRHKGRLKRLFMVGHKAEAEFVDLLRGSGWTVYEVDPNTGKQFRVLGYKAHFGGSMDGIAMHPVYTGGQWLNAEFKTHNTKSFTNFIAKGLHDAKPEHVAQMNIYADAYTLPGSVYFALNKNDSDVRIMLVAADPVNAQRMKDKAQRVIDARTPPPRISKDPNYVDCKYCDFYAHCWAGALVEVNCRSCEFARADANAVWHCERYNADIPKDVIKVGCPQHSNVNKR